MRWRIIPPKQLKSAAERLDLLHCIKGWSNDCPLIFENGDLDNRLAVRVHKIVPEIVIDDQSLILQTEADIFYPLNPFDTIKLDIKYSSLPFERAIHIISTP